MRSPLLLRVPALLVVGLVAACAFPAQWVTTPSGLRYRVVAPGAGAVSQPGQHVSIHETTALASGAVLYSSRGGDPITFLLGDNQVIAGVEEGTTGMRVGERRLLVVPPALSRRTSYPPNTPPDSTLHIDVELVQIRPE